MRHSPSEKENSVATSNSRIRQALSKQLAESIRTPPLPHTSRRVRGRTRFPGKATAVIGESRFRSTGTSCRATNGSVWNAP